jgi:hypothetical protein
MLNRRSFVTALASAAGAMTLSFNRSEADELEVEAKPSIKTVDQQFRDNFKFKNLDLHYFLGSLIAFKQKITSDPTFQNGPWNSNLCLYMENQVELLSDAANDMYNNPSFVAPNDFEHTTFASGTKSDESFETHSYSTEFIQILDGLLYTISRFDSRMMSSGITLNEKFHIRKYLNQMYIILAKANFSPLN